MLTLAPLEVCCELRKGLPDGYPQLVSKTVSDIREASMFWGIVLPEMVHENSLVPDQMVPAMFSHGTAVKLTVVVVGRKRGLSM